MKSGPLRILLKTTIPPSEDDWHVGRFSLLTKHLRSLAGADGSPLYEITPADRLETLAGDDADLETLARGTFNQLWLIATDATGALTPRDVANIAAFRARGCGVFLSRDHQDLGSCLVRLGLLGQTQHFQSINPEPDTARRRCDDLETPTITWPNYHSGANGDLQVVEAAEPLHPIMRGSSGRPISRLPAHPHEGVVGVPDGLAAAARVVARGRSRITGAAFNLCVAIEEAGLGRAVSDSSFHHIADYNWDPRLGCPSFVDEPPGDQVIREPGALDDVHAYVGNTAAWLSEHV